MTSSHHPLPLFLPRVPVCSLLTRLFVMQHNCKSERPGYTGNQCRCFTCTLNPRIQSEFSNPLPWLPKPGFWFIWGWLLVFNVFNHRCISKTACLFQGGPSLVSHITAAQHTRKKWDVFYLPAAVNNTSPSRWTWGLNVFQLKTSEE